MGQLQFSAHTGSSHGIPTSGDLLWRQILNSSVLYTMPQAERRLLPKIAAGIGKYVLNGLPIVDLGTGGEHAIRSKLAPIAKAVQSSRVVLVDGSPSVLTQARDAMRELTGVSITRVVDDFLDHDNTQYVDRAALVTYTGITIGNIRADNRLQDPPQQQLAQHIERVCAKSHGGYALVTFDSMLDEATNKADYEEHPSFHLNFLDQAVAESSFPRGVRDKIVYRAIPHTWHNAEGKPLAGVIGHYAEFTEYTSFEFAGQQFDIKAGTQLLMKNSFKYSPAFFKQSAAQADAIPIKTWREGSTVGVLLRSPYSPGPQAASAVQVKAKACG